MKNIEQIKEQPAVFLHSWKTKVDVISDFEDVYMSDEEYHATVAPYSNVTLWEEKKAQMTGLIEQWEHRHILFASYSYENYSGDAFVLFEEGGKLYEVNGSHCSCYGLEGQWEPEETTIEAIVFRLQKGNLGYDSYSGNEFSEQLANFLGVDLPVRA